jgi:hypothetical protein
LQQQSRLVFVRGIVTVPLVVGVILAADHGSITTVAWVMLGHITLAAAAVGLTLRTRAGIPSGALLGALAPLAAAAAVAWVATRVVAVGLDDAAPAVALVAATASGAAAYLAVLRVIQPGLLPQIARQAASTVRAAP